MIPQWVIAKVVTTVMGEIADRLSPLEDYTYGENALDKMVIEIEKRLDKLES